MINLENERKQQILRYLFPTEETLKFMCNDFFQELLNIIPTTLLISYNNSVTRVREENFTKVKNLIVNFLKSNSNYSTELLRLYKNKNIYEMIDDFIIGLTLFISNTNEKYKNIDVFKDKRCVCYSEISLIDII